MGPSIAAMVCIKLKLNLMEINSKVSNLDTHLDYLAAVAWLPSSYKLQDRATKKSVRQIAKRCQANLSSLQRLVMPRLDKQLVLVFSMYAIPALDVGRG